MKVSIIGIGRLGGALAIALAEKGYEIRRLISRNPRDAENIARLVEPKPRVLSPDEFEKISSDIIFITTQDAEIRGVAENLAEKLKIKPFVFHTSGSLSSAVLESLQKKGCKTGSLHPLVAVSDADSGAGRFGSAYFCVEGKEEALRLAGQIVEDLEGISFTLESKFKTLYHASAVMASGHMVALFSVALEMLAACNLPADKAREILFPLLKSTIENLSMQAPHEALTGSFARADAETLKRQIEALRRNASTEILEIFLQLGMRSLQLAGKKGLDKEKLREMKEIIENGK